MRAADWDQSPRMAKSLRIGSVIRGRAAGGMQTPVRVAHCIHGVLSPRGGFRRAIHGLGRAAHGLL